jgi:hypothetical protein
MSSCQSVPMRRRWTKNTISDVVEQLRPGQWVTVTFVQDYTRYSSSGKYAPYSKQKIKLQNGKEPADIIPVASIRTIYPRS